jgi:hypothetical protein
LARVAQVALVVVTWLAATLVLRMLALLERLTAVAVQRQRAVRRVVQVTVQQVAQLQAAAL